MEQLEINLKYTFKNKELLENALAHSSYANEKKGSVTSNERLEFLGDSVLGLVVSRYLFERMENVNEGSLSKIRASLVCEDSLASVARDIGLGAYLRLGHGEERQGGRERSSILSDALEAVFAAIYLDSNFEMVEEKIKYIMSKKLEEGITGRFYHDYKTILQEALQKKNHARVTYKLIREEGPDHEKRFVVEAVADGKTLAEGVGLSKKEAEQLAAKYALEYLGER